MFRNNRRGEGYLIYRHHKNGTNKSVCSFFLFDFTCLSFWCSLAAIPCKWGGFNNGIRQRLTKETAAIGDGWWCNFTILKNDGNDGVSSSMGSGMFQMTSGIYEMEFIIQPCSKAPVQSSSGSLCQRLFCDSR